MAVVLPTAYAYIKDDGLGYPSTWYLPIFSLHFPRPSLLPVASLVSEKARLFV